MLYTAGRFEKNYNVQDQGGRPSPHLPIPAGDYGLWGLQSGGEDRLLIPVDARGLVK